MVRGCDQTIGGERFASGVNLITRTKNANNRFVSERRRTRECGRAIYYYSVGKKLHRLVPNFVPILLFSYSPPPPCPPSGYPLFDPSLVRWSVPYSTLMTIRTVTYHSMAVEIIYRFVLTFGDPYIICLYQLCYDCGGNGTAFSVLCHSNHRQRTTKTFSLIHILPDRGRYWGSFKDFCGHSWGHLQRFTSTKTKWTGRSTYIATPTRHICRKRWEEKKKTTPKITRKKNSC